MKKNKTIVALILLLVILISVGIWAFAKYTTTVSGTGSATVAAWSFTGNGEGGTTITNVSLADTCTNVAEGKIAPGTEGNFAIGVDATGSEVAIAYTISISNITNKPANLKFYSDASFETELAETSVGSGVYTTTGTIAIDAESKALSSTVYWKWAYETLDGESSAVAGDTNDTAVASATDKAITFDVSVTGTQVTPVQQ